MPRPRLVAALAVLFALDCAEMQQVTDRALTSLSLKDACPEAAEGRAAGGATADATVSCFAQSIREKSADLMLRVTCRGRGAASCLQTAGSKKDAEAAISGLARGSWNDAMGSWRDGTDGRTLVYAIDTSPSDAVVKTVTVRQIVAGDRWAVTDLGELGRETAQRKIKAGR